ncbi:hypothetical protein IEQ34_015522 [Dendrobium chrysotoxum]|uniref:Protein TIFY n=1 Tax=Dendrobium chrysotoxum TaxID=161865 RepID=A0AAV7G098_DENCH|nr:hypothetical protein IEQ34_015522 [Dendrobium chrysotoxum]
MEENQRRAKEKSSFAVTCSLLSQFLKETRSHGDLQGIDRLYQQQEKAKDFYQPPTTMNLFPGSDVSAETRNNFNSDEVSERNATIFMDPSTEDTGKASKQGEQKREKELNGQLTIFYNGKVMIFDNFPAMKAKDLMEMASKGKVFHPQSINVNSANTGATAAPPLPPEARASDLSMPIARRASLHRFLEKRKDRINSNAPYTVKGLSEMEPTSEMKPEKNLSWLALGHNSSFSSD